jgi:hypothetical protein
VDKWVRKLAEFEGEMEEDITTSEESEYYDNVTNHRMAHTPKMAHFEANQPLHLNISTPYVVIKVYNS